MKTISCGVLSLVFSTGVFAQGAATSFDQMDFENMARQAEQAQTCMAQIDEQQLSVLEQQAKEFEQKIRVLCESGERSQAQSAALKYAMDINDNATLKTIRQCTQKLSGMMQNIMPQLPSAQDYEDLDSRHICD